jgi:hypothetical protein
MVRGLPRFRAHFKGFDREFVLIGGTACDGWFGTLNLPFRTTKDVDVVLVVEALTPAFLKRFWEFVVDGRYQTRQRTSGEQEYFRFMKPGNNDFPAKIELFSRQPEGIALFDGQEIVPVPTGEDVSSLSAILMDGEYYGLILDTRVTVADLPMVSADGLIPLKARAWLDLSRRKEAGQNVDADDIAKHRNDVFRLVPVLPVGGHYALPERVRSDLRRFLAAFPVDSEQWPRILSAVEHTIRRPPSPQEMVRALVRHFGL